MAFSGRAYWVDYGNEDVLGTWNSVTGEVHWLTIFNTNLPTLPVTGGTLRDQLGQFGTLASLGDNRVATALSTYQAETQMVFNVDLTPDSATYWLDEVLSGGAGPDQFNAVLDPVLDALWVPRLRNKDFSTGSVDTWTAYNVSDGSIHSSEARTVGAWDYTAANDDFRSEVYGRCVLIGRDLYRTDQDGFAERYRIGGGGWDVTTIFATGRSFTGAVTGARNDGTPVFFTSSRTSGFTGPELFHLATYTPDWVPISSPSATIGAATKLGDLTPTNTWRIDETGYRIFAGGGNAAGVQIINDIAYYFRVRDDYTQEFVALDLATDTREIVFSVPETYLKQDGTITTSDDPDWYYDLLDGGFGIAVVPSPPLQITGQIDKTRVRPYVG